MSVLFDPRWAYALLLCTIRIGTALSLAPFIGGYSIPTRIRMFLVVTLAAALTSNQVTLWPTPPADAVALFLEAGTEAVNGALLAFGIFTAFAAFSLAGKLLDIQIGFSVGSVFDPVTRRQSGVLGPMLDLFAVVVFFTANLHHVLVRGLAANIEMVPFGHSMMPTEIAGVVKQFGVMFVQGMLLAAPVAICLLMLDIGLAVLSRNIPQLNIFVISMPIKVIVGISMLAFSVSYLAPTINQTLGTAFTYWIALAS